MDCVHHAQTCSGLPPYTTTPDGRLVLRPAFKAELRIQTGCLATLARRCGRLTAAWRQKMDAVWRGGRGPCMASHPAWLQPYAKINPVPPHPLAPAPAPTQRQSTVQRPRALRPSTPNNTQDTQQHKHDCLWLVAESSLLTLTCAAPLTAHLQVPAAQASEPAPHGSRCEGARAAFG